MKVLDNDFIIFVDVDDTLVMWSDLHTRPHDGAIGILDETDGTTEYLTPHKRHIEIIKKFKARGYTVVVWSGGGYKWANSVCKALQLEDTVDLVLSKPIKYIDDLDCREWMPNRLYLDDYKKEEE